MATDGPPESTSGRFLRQVARGSEFERMASQPRIPRSRADRVMDAMNASRLLPSASKSRLSASSSSRAVEETIPDVAAHIEQHTDSVGFAKPVRYGLEYGNNYGGTDQHAGVALSSLAGNALGAEPAPWVQSNNWTGRISARERIMRIHQVAPAALLEIDQLVDLIEQRRFNDPETLDALALLRELHDDIGALISAAEHGKAPKRIMAAIEARRAQLLGLLSLGAKVALVAPIATYGIVQILAYLCGIAPNDGQVVGAVFGSMAILDYAESKRTTGASKGE